MSSFSKTNYCINATRREAFVNNKRTVEIASRGGMVVRKTCLCAGVALFALATAASAAETMAYKYDARGRLIEVKRTGTVNNNVQVNYTHDKANNRKSVVAIGSPDGTPPPPPPPPPPNNPPVANADSASSTGNARLRRLMSPRTIPIPTAIHCRSTVQQRAETWWQRS